MILRPIHLALLAFACACADAPAAEPPSAREERPVEGDTVVRPAEVEPLETLYDTATVDVDGDGTPERVELGSNIPRDPRYRDAHHRWSVIVRDGAQSYPLLHEYLPAAASFWVVPADSGGPAAILIQVNALYGPTEGMRVEKFVFDGARGGYVRTGVVDAWSRHALYRGPDEFPGEMLPTGKGRHDAREHDAGKHDP